MRATYGIDLREVVEARSMPVDDLADLVMWLPAGCVLWQATGGPLARSREEQALLLVDLRIRQFTWMRGGKNGPEPKYPSHPPEASERRRLDAVTARKAARYARRQQRLTRGEE